MPFNWTTESVINLIELYRNAECLWNPRDKIYKDRYRKQDFWVEISNAMGASVEEVKKKIKNLVGQYYREKKNYRTYKKSGAGASFITKWFAYKYLEFLSDKNTVRHCSEKGIADTTLNEPHSPNSSENDDDENEGEKEGSKTQDIAQFVSEEDQLSTQQQNTQSDTIDENIRTKSDNMEHRDVGEKLPKEKPREKQTYAVTEKPEDKPQTSRNLSADFKRPAKRRCSQKLSNKETSDERQEEAYLFLKDLQKKQHLKDNFSIFGEHVACKIRRLRTEYAQNTAEHLIENILWEASTGKYDQPYPYYGSPQFYMPSASSSSSVTPEVTPLLSPIEHVSTPSPQMLSSPDPVATVSMSSNIQEPANEADILYKALSSVI